MYFRVVDIQIVWTPEITFLITSLSVNKINFYFVYKCFTKCICTANNSKLIFYRWYLFHCCNWRQQPQFFCFVRCICCNFAHRSWRRSNPWRLFRPLGGWGFTLHFWSVVKIVGKSSRLKNTALKTMEFFCGVLVFQGSQQVFATCRFYKKNTIELFDMKNTESFHNHGFLHKTCLPGFKKIL